MATKAAQQETVSAKLIEQWEQVGGKLAALAEEFPEKKYDCRPVEGVRTLADVLRHVAFWNRFVAESARGKKADDTSNKLSKWEYASKARIVDALRRSAEDAASSLKERGSELDVATAQMVMTFVEHTCEHYGQLVVYARMDGIVPPTSRGVGEKPQAKPGENPHL